MKVLVSACLIGENCKYNGKNNLNNKVVEFLKDKEVITICPEILAGFGIPRPCIEINKGKVIDQNGKDVTKEINKGIELAINKIKNENIDLAILQSRSPTCGVKQIYDGTFSGKLIDGSGLFTKALMKLNIKVIDAKDI